LTTWVTFVPCFIWIFAGAPYVERLRSNVRLSAALAAVTAAVVGVIANLALWFAQHYLFRVNIKASGAVFAFDWPLLASIDWAAAALSILAIAALFHFKQSPFRVLAGCALLGIMFRLIVAGNI
jgi:chromate transporter